MCVKAAVTADIRLRILSTARHAALDRAAPAAKIRDELPKKAVFLK